MREDEPGEIDNPTPTTRRPGDDTRVRSEGMDAPSGTRVRALEQDAADAPSDATRLRAVEAPSEGTRVRSAQQIPQPQGTRVRAPDLPDGTRLRPPERIDSAARAPAEVVPGAVIKDRFVLEERIGRGGMGLVFRALDRNKQIARNPDPYVALKALSADFRAHPQALMALEREASKAQSLAHPNIVTVFDFDLAGGTPFITMELLRGSSLEQIIDQAGGGGLDRARALPIIRGIAEGLAYAHRKGIVHSDLKPGNVFVLADGTPKLLDFGIARAVPGRRTGAGPEDVFDAGELGAYTEAYATREMIAGDDPDPADDVYALGLIAYELIAGRHPFKRLSAEQARSTGAAIAPLRGLKRRERRAIERALAFERRERFADAGAFLRALQGVPTIQKVLVAAVAVLIVGSAGLWTRSYLQSLPAQPLEALPPAVQQAFHEKIRLGNEALDYMGRTGDISASADAAENFGEAYRLHERDPEAVRGLKAAADKAIEWYRKLPDRQQARVELEKFRARSDYYQSYGPLTRAIRAAGGD